MTKRLAIAILVAGLLPVMACFPGRSTAPRPKRPEKIEAHAGRIIPSHSLSIDANYDPRLNDLIAGYKLLPVIIKNMSLRNVTMDAKRDRWTIVGEKKQRYRAINSLRYRDPPLWRELPEKMQTLIDYPEIVPINYSVTFDLLLPKKAVLDYFVEIRYFNAALQQWFILEKRY